MSSLNKHTILIADDDDRILDMYSQALAMVEYKVLQARDGKEAVEIVRENANLGLDLIFLDILMPKMDGFDALKEIRKIGGLSRTPVVMLTNLNRPEDMAEAKRLGAVEFLVKVKTSPHYLTKKVSQILKIDEE